MFLLVSGVFVIESSFKELVRHGVVESLRVNAVEGGYILRIQTAIDTRNLTLHRGGDRVFKTLDAVASVLLSSGAKSAFLSLELPPVPEKAKVVPPPAHKRVPPKKKKRR